MSLKSALINPAVKAVLQLFKLLPLNRRQILLDSFNGKGCCCNPKYICDTLMRLYPGEFSYIWASGKEQPELFPEGEKVQFVAYRSPAFFRACMTSGVIVENGGLITCVPFRKKQLIIDTWHGGGAYKKVGVQDASREEGEAYRKLMKKTYAPVRLFLSSSRHFTKHVIRDSFLYEGEVMECGMPRNDLLLTQPDWAKEKVRRAYGLPAEEKLVIYAPTFRGDFRNANLELEEALEPAVLACALKNRFGGHWTVLFRAHHAMSDTAADVLSATEYPDMQELLSACDVLVTDYSSSVWDFCLTGKPAFLFAPDLGAYVSSRGLETSPEDWPYPFAETNAALAEKIAQYDENTAKEKIRHHLEALESCEGGHAGELVARRIAAYGGIANG